MSLPFVARERPERRFHAAPAPPRNYCPIPQRLVADLHDTPLAIGLYALVGRLFLIEQAPIPLSVPDVMRYDPTLSRGALIRAFHRLLDGGWLIEARQRGRKTRYTPTWGAVRGRSLPWRMDSPCLGRPRHLHRLPLDRALLDICMGKLTPHPVQTAPITRYLTAPALSLYDVGCYALAQAGLPRESPALAWLGAVRDGQAYPLPEEPRLLALISQRALALSDGDSRPAETELTASGARRLGLAPLAAPAAETVPLFFVPPGMIGSMIRPMIGSMIGQNAATTPGATAVQSDETPLAGAAQGITWDQPDEPDLATPPPTPAPTDDCGGGGTPRSGALRETPRRRPAAAAIPDTAATRALAAINVLPEQQRLFADAPIAVVEAAIADGRAREGVRDLAGWVVTLLRNQRDYGWRISTPTPRADSPEALRALFGRYADAPDGADEQPPAPPESGVDTLERLWRDVQAGLRVQTSRAEFDNWLRTARLLAIDGGTATVTVPNRRTKEAIERRYLGAIREQIRQCGGDTLTVRLILAPAAPPPPAGRTQPPAEADEPPAWIGVSDWQALPALARAALLGSRLVDGRVEAASQPLARLLETRYAAEVAGLLRHARPADTTAPAIG